MRASNALRSSRSLGELIKFWEIPGPVGSGNRFNNLIALGSKRPAAAAALRLFSPHVASVNVVVPGPQVPNGSRTYSRVPAGTFVLTGATMPDTGSACPAITRRVVAGSKIVPVGTVRPR